MSNHTQKTFICQKQVTIQQAKLLHKAMLGDADAMEVVKIGEVADLQFRHSFPRFLEANRDQLALIEWGR